MTAQIVRPPLDRPTPRLAPAVLVMPPGLDAAREAVSRARANGSFLVVRDTARRIAGADRDPAREDAADGVARLLIEECARQGVAMLADAREAVERLRRDGAGAVVAL